MTQTTTTFDLQQLSIQDRIDFYEQELAALDNPKTFRERVLLNVYRCLLQSSLRQYGHQMHLVS
ncbi:hypothetical protein CKO12_00195 [Chromatium okenii]|uniref:hypothetical protein n=1 Tax=Chromatium okenii TaxID=61644 RepID=UPI001903EF3F|nr:hypothetical protein [Chromatium okenii]MBK1640326.1 hypothetical protein [Chromatium okenii]